MEILKVNDLKKTYTSRMGGSQVQALKGVSFTVERGEYVAIMGESGSGKTTLLNILAALDKPTSGSVELDGKAIASVREREMAAFRRENLGFVFQEFNLLDTFTLRDNSLLLLFLGLLLGAVCLFATALIIYYKQISEGYEDRTRFQIMEKIGMSRQEVRKTIGRQVLLVFFLPLAVAGIHMAVMSPILTRMMKVLLFFNIKLYVICTLITFAVFALVYVLIYLGTSKTYYKIVR